jgi:nucleotide-binding universal stress UspA family protein
VKLPPRKILVCTDYSAASDSAVLRAAALAARHRARLTMLHVLPVSAIRDAADLVADRYFSKDEPRFDPKRAEEQQSERLRDAARQLSNQAGIEIDTQLRTGRPAAEISAAAHEIDADLVVIGGHGAHRVRSMLLGTTTHRLLRSSPAPVLVVKRPPPFEYATVLLPTDLSEASSLAAAAALALVPDAQFHVAHAFELPYAGMMTYANVEPTAVLHYQTEEGKRLAPELERFVQSSGLPADRVSTHLEHGSAVVRIAELSQSLSVDLIAIAARGKSEVERLFIGSVALNVVQAADCDVLLVRSETARPDIDA